MKLNHQIDVMSKYVSFVIFILLMTVLLNRALIEINTDDRVTRTDVLQVQEGGEVISALARVEAPITSTIPLRPVADDTLLRVEDTKDIFVVQLDIPLTMRRGHSNYIRISLVNHDAETRFIDEALNDRAVYSSTPIPTASRFLSNQTGSQLTARLGAASFECDLVTAEVQSLRQDLLDWTWNCSSDKIGAHIVSMTVFLVPIEEPTTPTIEYPLFTGYEYTLVVREPLFTSGQINLATILTGVVLSFVSWPAYNEFYKRRAEAAKQKETEKEAKKVVVGRK